MHCSGVSGRQISAAPTLHVTCWETFYVSNLTAQPLRLLPLGAAAAAQDAIACDAGATVPVSIAWAAAGSRLSAAAGAASAADADAIPAQQPANAATWPCNVVVQPSHGPEADSRSGGGPVKGGGNGSDAAAAAAAAASCAVVSLAEPCPRRWLSVSGADGRHQQVAYRLLRGRGRHHLVLYEDQQPPLRVVNAASMHLEVGLAAPQHQGCVCCNRLHAALEIGPDTESSHAMPCHGITLDTISVCISMDCRCLMPGSCARDAGWGASPMAMTFRKRSCWRQASM